MDNIYLTGMMGCGKTTLGKMLARRLSMSFIDLDECIVQKTGMPITEIFDRYGQQRFREIETEALQNASEMKNTVVACGGGIVLSPENVEIMKKSGKVVYIERDIGEIVRTVDTQTRPLLQGGREDAEQIFRVRKPLYEGACDIKIHNTEPEAATSELAQKLKSMHG
ncbi:MAG: shikimate kinase [Christensenellaceae bacterium]|jgi:shikimate kinase